MNYYVLTTKNNNADKQNTEFIVENPAAVKVLDKLIPQYPSINTLYEILNNLFKSQRQDYKPIEHYNYVPNLADKYHELIGLHETLYRMQRENTICYLIRERKNDNDWTICKPINDQKF